MAIIQHVLFSDISLPLITKIWGDERKICPQSSTDSKKTQYGVGNFVENGFVSHLRTVPTVNLC